MIKNIKKSKVFIYLFLLISMNSSFCSLYETPFFITYTGLTLLGGIQGSVGVCRIFQSIKIKNLLNMLNNSHIFLEAGGPSIMQQQLKEAEYLFKTGRMNAIMGASIIFINCIGFIITPIIIES